jgi:hypothetical protein
MSRAAKPMTPAAPLATVARGWAAAEEEDDLAVEFEPEPFEPEPFEPLEPEPLEPEPLEPEAPEVEAGVVPLVPVAPSDGGAVE